MHDAITIGVPVLAILFGVLVNQQGLKDLRIEINARFNAMDARIDRIHNDFAQFHHTQGQHDSRLDALERPRNG
jgi:hypothetical protein